jgi:hypothetical protein
VSGIDVIVNDDRKGSTVKRLLTALLISLAAMTTAGHAGAITGGSETGTGHGNVGFIGLVRDGVPRGACSGTLIAPTVFLTAGHCTAGLAASGAPVWVSFDPAFNPASSTRVPVASLHTAFTPDYSIKGMDIGVAVLAQSVGGVTPAVLAPQGYIDELASTRSLRDAVFTSVGYGRCGREVGGGPPTWCPSGTRRSTTSPFAALNGTWLRLLVNDTVTDQGGPCFGDSGGPQFHGGFIVSITTGGDSVCQAHSVNFRIDTAAARAFLERFVALD